MTTLYRLSKHHKQASAALGLEDVERRHHIQQLTHGILAGCKRASQPFSWLRASGLRSIAAVLAAGLEVEQALAAALNATYSQVLEVLLSALDRDLISAPPTPPPVLPPLATAAVSDQTAAVSSSSSSTLMSSQQQEALLTYVGRYPAGHAPAAASSDELLEAFKVLQVLVLLHSQSRNLLCAPQYLQLVTARACEAPDCLPAALNTLLALLQGSEEAQGLFITTGGLDLLLARTLQQAQHTDTPANMQAGQHRDLLLELLVFLQLLLGWVITGTGSSSQHHSAAVSLMTRHFGSEATEQLIEQLPDIAQAMAPNGPAAYLVPGSHKLHHGAADVSAGSDEHTAAEMSVASALRSKAEQVANSIKWPAL